MRKLLLLAFLTLTACTTPQDPAATAPPDTISRYPSTAPPATRDNTIAVLPTDAEVPGYTRTQTDPVLKLCPTSPQDVPSSITHAFGAWQAGDRTMTVAAAREADQLLATLAPPDCPDKDDQGNTYRYDRQPYESPDGWVGSLNTSMRTTPAGTKQYEAIYLLSKGDAVVNVVAAAPVGPTVNYDPATDEVAAHYLQLVLNRFAV